VWLQAGQTARIHKSKSCNLGKERAVAQKLLLPTKLPPSEQNRVAYCLHRGLTLLCFKCSLLASSRQADDTHDVRRFAALSAKQLRFTRGRSSELVKIAAHNLQSISAASDGAPGAPARLRHRSAGEDARRSIDHNCPRSNCPRTAHTDCAPQQCRSFP